jgi:hypothetical protein
VAGRGRSHVGRGRTGDGSGADYSCRRRTTTRRAILMKKPKRLWRAVWIDIWRSAQFHRLTAIEQL